MSREDRERWDEKWAARAGFDLAPSPLLLRYAEELSGGGEALDVATGLGQNALWLAEQGYHVTAVDISPVALARGRAEAEKRGLTIDFVEADLDSYRPAAGAYDLVSVFRFLNRELFPALEAALKPGGWLFYQTYNLRRRVSRPNMAQEYLVEFGELAGAFGGLALVEAGDEGDASHVICRRR